MRRCPFHRVEPSPWPILAASGLGVTALSFIFFLHGDSFVAVGMGLGQMILAFWGWFRDIIVEATFLGKHTKRVQRGLLLGFMFFLTSELMFFITFFWGFVYSCMAPGIALGFSFPPEIGVMKYTGVPMINSALLLGTVLPVRAAMKSVRACDLKGGVWKLVISIIMGVLFVFLQGYEFYTCPFTIADGVYGCCFFALTGLHGSHVVGGLVFLIIGAGRLYYGHFSSNRHLGLTFSVWYWHFVDAIWVVVYLLIYLWVSLGC
nr:cytochrome c oxidase subunit III [Catillopecten margaritatus]